MQYGTSKDKRRLGRLVEELDRVSGPVTGAELAAVDREWLQALRDA
jgi:hypothetical protein